MEPVPCQEEIPALSLIDNTLWVDASPSQDPFEDRPAMFECLEDSVKIEGDIFEVNTDGCEYLSVQQELNRDVETCETVQMVVSYFPLFAVERAEAHVALAMDEDIVWERRIPIPSPDDLIIARWKPHKRLTKGTVVTFHLHNHGVNDWRFIDLAAGTTLGEPTETKSAARPPLRQP